MSAFKVQASLKEEERQKFLRVKSKLETSLMQKISDGVAIRYIINNFDPDKMKSSMQ
ncbi:hypothetical protein [Leptospira bandrabouensis]|uniref:hypothetical protein n=1 Tax=Leptospira bandrabouensis TaxID=2484903 RepID=UPI00142DD564|nr:hypothetical protein [Leptospira bandrabouensis]